MNLSVREIRGIAAQMTCDECGLRGSIPPASFLEDGTEVMDMDDLLEKIDEMGWVVNGIRAPSHEVCCPACWRRREFQTRKRRAT